LLWFSANVSIPVYNYDDVNHTYH